MKRIITVLFLLLAILYGLNSFAIDVENIVCGSGVKNRQIINPSDEFKVGGKVWCLSTITHIKKPTFIIHRWVFEGRHFDVKLKVLPYKRFRTWSYKTIYPSMKGVWKLEVIDGNGKLMKEKIFVVK